MWAIFEANIRVLHLFIKTPLVTQKSFKIYIFEKGSIILKKWSFQNLIVINVFRVNNATRFIHQKNKIIVIIVEKFQQNIVIVRVIMELMNVKEIEICLTGAITDKDDIAQK